MASASPAHIRAVLAHSLLHVPLGRLAVMQSNPMRAHVLYLELDLRSPDGHGRNHGSLWGHAMFIWIPVSVRDSSFAHIPLGSFFLIGIGLGFFFPDTLRHSYRFFTGFYLALASR
jgi:hypothetical protein